MLLNQESTNTPGFTSNRSKIMPSQFQHQVCYSVLDRVTFVNGVWQGEDIPESQRQQKDVEACPLIWNYLQSAGAEGWQLVCVLESPNSAKAQLAVRTLFLKRELETRHAR